MNLRYLLLLVMTALTSALCAQNIIYEDDKDQNHFDTDSVETTGVPEGIYAWTVDERFGDIRPADYDTIPHGFQNRAFTDGMTGHYNYLGNLGSPRISRLFSERTVDTYDGQFFFADPYDFFLSKPQQVLFTNTKSPFTNLTYHECGNKQHGEDRIRALFSVNAGKKLGMGFKLDYLYGRGYYDSQSTSQFDATLFASYRDERYQMHVLYSANHLKTAENGGIEDDAYVTNPEAYSTKYGPEDMPTNLSKTYNKQNVNTLFLTHRYNLGFTRWHDATGKVVKINRDKGLDKFSAQTAASDSAAAAPNVAAGTKSLAVATSDSLKHTADMAQDTVRLTSEFVPVTAFIHTFRVDHNNRKFISNATEAVASSYYGDFYLPGDSASDFTKYIRVENVLAVELHEGLNKWLPMGFRLFARHEFYKITLPDLADNGTVRRKNYTDNYITVGAQLLRDESRTLRYHATGEIRTTGTDWGDFKLQGDASLGLPFLKDSLHVTARAAMVSELPTFYLRHFHARNAWWDTDPKRQVTFRAAADLRWKKTRLTFTIQHIQNYAYLQETQNVYTNSENVTKAYYGVGVSQKSGAVELMGLTLGQNFRWGILNWENELTWQMTTDKEVYPLPALNFYTNLYIDFRIAKVLHTELGADLRYFTKYYAPAYAPIVGQYAVQSPDRRVKLGNYPTINVYANFNLKRTTFYVMASHVNYSSGAGMPFLVPHYPLNRLVLRLGLTWNFIN